MAAAVSNQAAQPVVPAVQHAPVTAPARYGNMSLYVGNLDPSVNEGQLCDLFGQVAQVSSLRVCRDQTRMHSLGYAYVNFTTAQDAANAKELLNFAPINGKPIRIMFSHRDPSIRKSGYANLFIKNLDKSIDNKALLDIFSSFGTVLSCKVAADASGQSKGYGFVQYDNEESSETAMAKLNGMVINDRTVDIKPYVRAERSTTFQNIYVKNLPETTTDDELKNLFVECGAITSAAVMRDGNGKSRCFGFVNFEAPGNAVAAIDKFNGTTFNDKVLFVGKAQKKSERQAELRAKFEQERISRFEKLQGANLYLKNLDDSINNDEDLKELFSEFGTITSCKVMYDDQGVSKGSGFVAFSTPQEAEKALNEMNGKMIGRKPLYVAVAQRKEERKARLQARFAQIRAPGGMTPLPSAIHGYHPGAPRLGHQQLYFGQGTPGLVPQQPAGYGFQQQIMPGMRPPNFIMPYHLQRQGQPGQRTGVHRGGNFQQVQQQQQQQLMHRNSNQGLRYVSNVRNGVDTPMSLQGPMSPMMSLPFDGSGMPVTSNDIQRSGPVPMSTLASALASTTPDNQRLMLGEQLFPLVERIEPKLTAKVTGMLLEMDQTEVLHLIESPDALKDKVAEAMDVLCNPTSNTGVTDQLAALDLN